LRSQLQVDHHADAAVQLEEGGGLPSVQDLAQDGNVFSAEFRCCDVRIEPATDQTVGLLVRERPVGVAILLDDSGPSVIDLGDFRGILIVHRPELGGFAVGERQIRERPAVSSVTE